MAKHRFNLKKKKFIILLGGPGLFDRRDRQHDNAWFNYAHPIMLEAKNGTLAKPNEDLVWLIFAPAYSARWDDDSKPPPASDTDALSRQRFEKHVKNVKEYGALNYLDYIKKKSQEYQKAHQVSVTIIDIIAAADFWSYLNSQAPGSISRIWYSGHAQGDLWLTLVHRADGKPYRPDVKFVVFSDEITKNPLLAGKFAQPGLPSKFIGCNTDPFAYNWNKYFQVKAEGADGKVDFGESSIEQIQLSASTSWRKYPFRADE